MAKYEVIWYAPNTMKKIVEADSEPKATYKVFKSELGKSLNKEAEFINFIKYIHGYTTKVTTESESKI
jgi:transcription antitermination factor NusA-like protein